ncbi:uncharacterized protein BO80DRAFT_79730 [Aspergillus ibericus CBS 121593]|uniref:Uncharacterized protein n=1 Tax=Aspergillus ibericus CBS 121593 TaxID=1448316 RepID=A0A395HCQ5_9EURO|nr:hypothetical protein BO80DRAFT_79730 [Aspergillus ibericus CBS 121593]RAL05741.1 hypothetical protein BO80DRAFT_79730 [Aspergillus ibericus CBS 121593]
MPGVAGRFLMVVGGCTQPCTLAVVHGRAGTWGGCWYLMLRCLLRTPYSEQEGGDRLVVLRFPSGQTCTFICYFLFFSCPSFLSIFFV